MYAEQNHAFAKILFYYGLIGDNIQDKVKVTCPFHEDLKPSMLVNTLSDSFYCFGCNTSGKIIDFVRQMESKYNNKQLSDLQLMQLINKIINNKTKSANIQINIQTPLTNKQAIEEAKLYFYSLPKTYWYNIPKSSYIKQRGFNSLTLSKLDFRENYNHIYGIVAPMYDLNKFKGYICRATISKFNDYEIDRKYLYNKGFSRHNTLVGNYTKDWVIITEGFLDYAKLIQFGKFNSCAILGWKATNNQISKLQKYTTKVISALDNTPTGEAGTKYLSEYFDVIRFPFPSHKKDLGDLDKYDFNMAWSKIIKNKGVLNNG